MRNRKLVEILSQQPVQFGHLQGWLLVIKVKPNAA
jgi:hypothetical protein